MLLPWRGAVAALCIGYSRGLALLHGERRRTTLLLGDGDGRRYFMASEASLRQRIAEARDREGMMYGPIEEGGRQ